jgi:drug/metabolite transporter (DMT)-like permease
LIDASKGAIIFFFKPIVASLLAFFILHETLGMNVIVGTAFVVGGSAIMVLKRPDKPRQAEVAK